MCGIQRNNKRKAERKILFRKWSSNNFHRVFYRAIKCISHSCMLSGSGWDINGLFCCTYYETPEGRVSAMCRPYVITAVFTVKLQCDSDEETATSTRSIHWLVRTWQLCLFTIILGEFNRVALRAKFKPQPVRQKNELSNRRQLDTHTHTHTHTETCWAMLTAILLWIITQHATKQTDPHSAVEGSEYENHICNNSESQNNDIHTCTKGRGLKCDLYVH